MPVGSPAEGTGMHEVYSGAWRVPKGYCVTKWESAGNSMFPRVDAAEYYIK